MVVTIQELINFWLKQHLQWSQPWSFHSTDICSTYLQSWWSWSCRPGCLSAARLGPSLCRGWSSASSLLLLQTGSCCGFPPCCHRPQRPCCWYSDSCWTSGSSGLWRQWGKNKGLEIYRQKGIVWGLRKCGQEYVDVYARNHHSVFIYQEQIWRCPKWPATCWCWSLRSVYPCSSGGLLAHCQTQHEVHVIHND